MSAVLSRDILEPPKVGCHRDPTFVSSFEVPDDLQGYISSSVSSDQAVLD